MVAPDALYVTCSLTSYKQKAQVDLYCTLIAAALIAYPIKFPNFPTKLIKYVHNLIEIYMYIGYRLGQRHRRSPAGVLVLRSCGTSQRIQYHFKVKLVNFWLFWYFLCIFPIKLMFASTLTPNMTAELPLIRKL